MSTRFESTWQSSFVLSFTVNASSREWRNGKRINYFPLILCLRILYIFSFNIILSSKTFYFSLLVFNLFIAYNVMLQTSLNNSLILWLVLEFPPTHSWLQTPFTTPHLFASNELTNWRTTDSPGGQQTALEDNRQSWRTTDSHLKRIISTNCCICTVVPPDDGPRYARNR